ncbi:MAG: hypothetical protein II887_05585 [Bacteroidales bacterium]|nr:hypothetical protein [Bacteroidales bacterium]
MKKLALTLVMAFFAITAFAQNENSNVRIPSGYQGFLESGNTWHFDKNMRTTMQLSTTHGFYFNGNFYVGMGIALEFNGDRTMMPIYSNLRYVFINNKAVSPLVSLRLGSFISDEIGAYGDLGVGVRFASKRDFAVSLMVVGTYYDKVEGGFYDNNGYWQTGKISPSGIGLRMGIEW